MKLVGGVQYMIVLGVGLLSSPYLIIDSLQ